MLFDYPLYFQWMKFYLACQYPEQPVSDINYDTTIFYISNELHKNIPIVCISASKRLSRVKKTGASVSTSSRNFGGLSKIQTSQHLPMEQIGFPITLKAKFVETVLRLLSIGLSLKSHFR